MWSWRPWHVTPAGCCLLAGVWAATGSQAPPAVRAAEPPTRSSSVAERVLSSRLALRVGDRLAMATSPARLVTSLQTAPTVDSTLASMTTNSLLTTLGDAGVTRQLAHHRGSSAPPFAVR